MTDALPSQLEPLAPAATLAETRERLEHDTNQWPKGARRQMLNAVDRLGKLLGKPLTELPSDETALAALIDGELGWRSAGFKSPRALRDFKGRVARAARETSRGGLLRFTPRDRWLPEWRAFLDDIEAAIAREEEAPWTRRAIAHLAGYANSRGVVPRQVDSTLLADLLALHARNKNVADAAALKAINYARKAVDSARAWNRLVVQRDAKPWLRYLPDTLLEWDGRARIVNPPLSVYPEAFQADVRAYLETLAGADAPVCAPEAGDLLGAIPPELEDEAAWATAKADPVALTDVALPETKTPPRAPCRGFRALSAATIANHRAWIRQAAGAVVRRGVLPREQLQSLRDLCGYRAIHGATNDYWNRQGAKADGEKRQKAASTHVLVETLCSIARHWCDLPPDYVARMRAELIPRVRTESCGTMSAGRRTMLAQFEEPWALLAWFDHPETLFARAEARRQVGQPLRPRDVADVEVALLCRLLGVLPVRRANVATLRFRGARPSLQLRRHKGEKSWLFWRPEETKNNRYLRAELDPQSEAMIRAYLAHWRPLYLTFQRETPDSDCLFPGRVHDAHGVGHREPASLGRALTARMAEVGLAMTLHLARHLGAKIMVDWDPRLVGTAAELLGIAESTVRKFYLADRSVQASAALQAIVKQRVPAVRREWRDIRTP